MTSHEQRVADWERERAEAAGQLCGQVVRNGQVVEEANAVTGSILVEGVVLRPPEPEEEERTPVGGWDASVAGVPKKPRPASKETLVVRGRGGRR